ncbi:hypothetical protein ACEPAF_300 [Sanghuangporus sanghuang]
MQHQLTSSLCLYPKGGCLRRQLQFSPNPFFLERILLFLKFLQLPDQVSCVLNAAERTIEGFKDVLATSGWQLHELRKDQKSSMIKSAVISVPI